MPEGLPPRTHSGATSGHDLTALRELNHSAVLRCLHHHGAQTVGDLTQRTGLSRPTVEAALEHLTEHGHVAEAETPEGARRPGRPARHYRFRAEAGSVLGVDVGLHKVVLQRADLLGEVISVHRLESDAGLGSEERLDQLLTTVQEFIESPTPHDRPTGPLLSTCLALPGVVDSSGHLTSTVIPEWTGTHVADRLADSIPGMVRIENDVNMAAVAEHWRGSATEVQDVACVLAGRRISIGLLLGGRLYRGHRGGAGELGSLPSLRLFAAHEELRRIGEHDRPVEALAAALERGDPAADEVLTRYARALAPGVAALLLSVDPELLVLSGGISPLTEPLIPLLEHELQDMTLHLPRIVPSTLGKQSVALGAVRTALDQVDQDLNLD